MEGEALGPVLNFDDGAFQVVATNLVQKLHFDPFALLGGRRIFRPSWPICLDSPRRKGSSSPDATALPAAPLADRIRPRALSEVIGQQKVLDADGPLGAMLGAGSLSSLIL